jgi:hypothetical protein
MIGACNEKKRGSRVRIVSTPPTRRAIRESLLATAGVTRAGCRGSGSLKLRSTHPEAHVGLLARRNVAAAFRKRDAGHEVGVAGKESLCAISEVLHDDSRAERVHNVAAVGVPLQAVRYFACKCEHTRGKS